MQVYKFTNDSIELSPSVTLPIEQSLFAIHKSGIYIASGNLLEVYNYSGIKKQTISAHQHSITNLVVGQQVLALVKINGIIF